MFNVTILKMKDIKRYFIGMLVTIVIIVLLNQCYLQIFKEKKELPKVVLDNNMIGALNQTVPVISSITNEEKNTIEKTNIKQDDVLQSILKTQISSIKGLENIENNNEEKEIAETKEEKQQEENPQTEKIAEAGSPTQVITNNPLKENYNTQYGKVKIKNETEYQLTEEILKPDITIENKNIVLFHTHSCESYTSSDLYPYIPTGTFRTTDKEYSVVRVGTELENQLKQYNYNVIHDTSYHDYPAYNGSYTRSLATVENILKTTPSDIIIDVHRDAIGSRSDYAPIVKIGKTDVAAQIMFVIRN